MSDQIKELIEKINQEGVVAAEKKAKEIEDQARSQAEMIIRKADVEAKRIVEEAADKARRLSDSTLASLKQSGRDTVLSLKKEISEMLQRIILAQTSDALNTQDLGKILYELIGSFAGKEEIVVTLSKENMERLGSGFISKLRDELKKGVVLKSSEDIKAGFVISYDGGRSSFDFTDKALSEYIATQLKPALSDILKE